MKILYYSPHPQLSISAPTGYGTHMREMVAAWRRMGIEVHTCIAGDASGENYQSQETNSGGRFRSIKKLIPKFLWETMRDLAILRFDKKQSKLLEDQILKIQPDVIYERVAYLQNSGIQMARKHGIRHVSEINAPYPQERVAFSGQSYFVGAAKDIEREILTYSNGISVVSSALKDYLVAILPEAEPKIIVVPNAINPGHVDFSDREVDELKRKYNLDKELVVGFVGSMFPYHGVDILIRAFAKMDESVRLRLLIIGDGSILSELKSLAKKLGILQKVIFTGSLPHREVYANIQIMDICCLPKTNWYCSPIKIFEYGLLRKPVIAPDVLPMHDVMGPDDGELVEPEVDAFHGALMKLIEDENRRHLIADNWYRKVMDDYTWDAAAKKALNLCT